VLSTKRVCFDRTPIGTQKSVKAPSSASLLAPLRSSTVVPGSSSIVVSLARTAYSSLSDASDSILEMLGEVLISCGMSTVELSDDVSSSSSSSSSSVHKKRPFADTVVGTAPCELLALSKETEPLFKKINGAVFPFKLAGALPRTGRTPVHSRCSHRSLLLLAAQERRQLCTLRRRCAAGV
jgi:hypothetical protein